jgi:hypothetical protein
MMPHCRARDALSDWSEARRTRAPTLARVHPSSARAPSARSTASASPGRRAALEGRPSRRSIFSPPRPPRWLWSSAQPPRAATHRQCWETPPSACPRRRSQTLRRTRRHLRPARSPRHRNTSRTSTDNQPSPPAEPSGAHRADLVHFDDNSRKRSSHAAQFTCRPSCS